MTATDTATTAGSPVVRLDGIRKRFGDNVAVAGLDLTVPAGATYGLLGPNGAGKTTAIRMILDIIEPDAGRVRLFGAPFDRFVLDRIGYLPEERGLYKKMKVRKILAFLAELKGIGPRESRSRIDEWIERFDLTDRADEKVEEYSKGMQQKLQFIGAVIHEPDLVILDEPFSGLDPVNQRVLREIITDLQRQGRTILFSTHIIEHAERICDHVCIMAEGKKVVDGRIAQVKREHGGEYVAVAFDDAPPDSGGIIRGSRLVRAVRDQGSEAEITLAPNADTQELLEWIIAQGLKLRRFERVEPSLEQIFIERAGGAKVEEMRRPEVLHA